MFTPRFLIHQLIKARLSKRNKMNGPDCMYGTQLREYLETTMDLLTMLRKIAISCAFR